jgi:hypothetical protein
MTAPRTNKEKFLAKYAPDKTELSLEEIARLSGMPIEALHEVERKGYGAYRTNLASVRLVGSFRKDPNVSKYGASMRLTPFQWARARVYAFVMKTPKVYYGADDDIRRKYKLE